MSETPDRVFTIEGADYPIPQLASLTLDEAVVFYRHTGFPVEELWAKPADVKARARMLDRLRDPAVVKAMLHVAVRRGHPDMPDTDIETVVGQVKLMDALTQLLPTGKDPDAVPLDGTNAPAASSRRRTTGASKRSGGRSPNGSDAPAGRRAPTTA